jgi:outer membrane scaffolding protein for murein synthesis (MipA/OmpV family)
MSQHIKHVLLSAILLVPLMTFAGQDKPLWEAGIGIAALDFPAYRGSDKGHAFVMPVPYFTYHGDFLKADRHGIRGSLFDSENVDLNLSLSASPPTKSNDVSVRIGMPDLKPTAEFGPQLDVTLWRNERRSSVLNLRLPLRGAFTLEKSPHSAGVVFSPNLNLDISDLVGLPGWNFGLLAGPIFATQRQHDYFYSVAPQYATAARPAYAASGGYSGTQFLVSLSKRFDHTWVGAFFRYDNLGGATFTGSPLVASHRFAAGGIALSWILGESQTRVSVDD